MSSWEGMVDLAKAIAPQVAEIYAVFVKEFEAAGFSRGEAIQLARDYVILGFKPPDAGTVP